MHEEMGEARDPKRAGVESSWYFTVYFISVFVLPR